MENLYSYLQPLVYIVVLIAIKDETAALLNNLSSWQLIKYLPVAFHTNSSHP